MTLTIKTLYENLDYSPSISFESVKSKINVVDANSASIVYMLMLEHNRRFEEKSTTPYIYNSKPVSGEIGIKFDIKSIPRNLKSILTNYLSSYH